MSKLRKFRAKDSNAFKGLQLYGDSNSNNYHGTNHDDVLTGYQLDDKGGALFLPAAAGDDQLYGYKGNDKFYGGGGNNILNGGDGSDTVLYVHSPARVRVDLNPVGNKIYAEVNNPWGGIDKLYDIENVVGSDYNDTLIGNNKPNVLASAKGHDEMTGRGGADTFVFSTGDRNIAKMGQSSALDFGTKTITDFNPAEDKIQIDVKAYYDHYKKVDFDYVHFSDNNQLTIGTGHGVATLENISQNQIADVLQKIEFIGEVNTSGTSGVDILIGNSDNNDLRGWNGDDYVYGGDGDDILYGREGKDVLLAGDGNDFLRGHQGDDILIGGDGADYFAFLRYTGTGRDAIMDFTASEGDKILIATNRYGISDLSEVKFNSSNNELLVKGNVIALLENQSGFDVNTHVELAEIWW
ncbi:MAG: calcium-binding protein [Cyanobacteria bacterium P01_H01_bin.35]